jgi:hypothetical protein
MGLTCLQSVLRALIGSGPAAMRAGTSAAQHQPQHTHAIGAQRHADTDLAGTALYRIRGHTVEANRCQNQRQDRSPAKMNTVVAALRFDLFRCLGVIQSLIQVPGCREMIGRNVRERNLFGG